MKVIFTITTMNETKQFSLIYPSDTATYWLWDEAYKFTLQFLEEHSCLSLKDVDYDLRTEDYHE